MNKNENPTRRISQKVSSILTLKEALKIRLNKEEEEVFTSGKKQERKHLGKVRKLKGAPRGAHNEFNKEKQ